MTGMTLAVTAAVLGALSFFEPCTIATHTLFSVRAHARPWPGCCRELLTLWATRSLLAVGLLLLAVTLTTPPDWSGVLPSAILATMATLYIVSRFLYIPVVSCTSRCRIWNSTNSSRAARACRTRRSSG